MPAHKIRSAGLWRRSWSKLFVSRMTRLASASIRAPRALGSSSVPVKDEDAARLSPLGHAHLNVLRRCSISSTPAEGLRQLGEVPNLPDSGDLEEEGA